MTPSIPNTIADQEGSWAVGCDLPCLSGGSIKGNQRLECEIPKKRRCHSYMASEIVHFSVSGSLKGMRRSFEPDECQQLAGGALGVGCDRQRVLPTLLLAVASGGFRANKDYINRAPANPGRFCISPRASSTVP